MALTIQPSYWETDSEWYESEIGRATVKDVVCSSRSRGGSGLGGGSGSVTLGVFGGGCW